MAIGTHILQSGVDANVAASERRENVPSAAMFYELIERGHYDDSMLRRVRGLRETLTGVQRLQLAMGPSLGAGELTGEQQQELVRELEKRLAKKLNRSGSICQRTATN